VSDVEIFQANRKATQRLRRLIKNCSDSDLLQKVSGDWSVLFTLAHLAFWDQRAMFVIESALKNGKVNAPYFDDQINDILPSIFSLIPIENIVRFTISTSEELDIELEQCPKEIISELQKVNIRLVDRSQHRNLHLDDIEKVIMKKKKEASPTRR
jgi:hypothetical protein